MRYTFDLIQIQWCVFTGDVGGKVATFVLLTHYFMDVCDDEDVTNTPSSLLHACRLCVCNSQNRVRNG